MPFSDEQTRKLKAPLRNQHVKERQAEGKTLHYLEGWHVVSEANRIFGFDGWDRETVTSECVWRTQIDQQFAASYITRVRIRVRAADGQVVREGLGSGEAIASTPGQAHERASKAAETDATKRALSTFGNSFGLSLYRDKSEPAKSVRPGVQQAGSAAQRVVRAVARAMRENDRKADDLSGPAATRRVDRQPANEAEDDEASRSHKLPKPSGLRPPHPLIIEPQMVTAGPVTEENPTAAMPDSHSETLTHTKPGEPQVVMLPAYLPPADLRAPVDKSVLTLSEPKRRRDRHHLRFVASQPCLVCGRTPSQAHHVRLAQPRALGRKVSDEFTVPLCAIHHHDLHMKGNEAEWWRGHNIEPLPIAEQLWATSSGLIK
jgi:DNA recombination protein Rad52